MSFHLVPHLSRLVAMVAKFFMCERSVQFDLVFFTYLLYVFFFRIFFINNMLIVVLFYKQHKSDPLQTDCLFHVLICIMHIAF